MLLWRANLEFVVDVVDDSDTPYSNQGNLIIFVRPVTTDKAKTLRSTTTTTTITNDNNHRTTQTRRRLDLRKQEYWDFAMSSEHRILEEMWRDWLAERLEYVMDKVEGVDNRVHGKKVCYEDLLVMLERRREKNESWREMTTTRQRGEAWDRHERDAADDERRRKESIHSIMLRDIAHRWLEIFMLDKNEEGKEEEEGKGEGKKEGKKEGKEESKEAGMPADINFSIRMKPLPPPPSAAAAAAAAATAAAAAAAPKMTSEQKNQTNHTRQKRNTTTNSITMHSTSPGKFQTPRFNVPGLTGQELRGQSFRQMTSNLEDELSSIVPLRKEARIASDTAKRLIDVVCLTEEELEEQRLVEEERRERETREAGYTEEQRLTLFLCKCGGAKNEKILINHGVEYRDLPTLNDQKLMEMKLIGMRNMLARRRFLKAIEKEFGTMEVVLKKEPVVLFPNEVESDEEESDESEESEEEEVE